jgi:hypothetical protein
MLIIGVDYHPSFQQISFLDQETGECGDRQAGKSSAGLAVRQTKWVHHLRDFIGQRGNS